MVTEIPNTLAPTSATWAKKHIFGFSDEDIKLDTQRQRMERAVAAELANTATIITHTGLFDNIDKLYKTVSGTTEGGEAAGGAPPPVGGPPPGGGPPPPPGGGGDLGGLPESRAKLENLLLESNDDDFIIKNSSLGDMENELLKILKD
jgi:hypothetical protein